MLTFVFTKGLALGLNGARGILLAAVLGPGDYGVFGTLVVVQQLLSYVALGMREGVAIKLARSSSTRSEAEAIYSSALVWGVCSALTCMLAVAAVHIMTGMPARHLAWVAAIATLSIVNEIFVNINRQENKLRKVAGIELLYNLAAIAVVLAFWSSLSVERALHSTLVGVLLSVVLYAATLPGVALHAASRRTARELIAIGLLPAVFSALLLLTNSFFVLAANWLSPAETVGLVAFGGNISTLLLFGLNTVSWGLASRSMARLYVAPGAQVAPGQVDLSDVFFRFGVVVTVLLALGVAAVLDVVLIEYEGAGVYVLHLCLFQSYGLLLFNELNFLNVNARLAVTIGAYAALLLVLGAACVLAADELLTVMQFGTLAYFVLSLFVVLYGRRLGYRAGPISHRIAALSFPAVCVLAWASGGNGAVAGVCSIFLVAAAVVYREPARQLFARHMRAGIRSQE